MSGAEDPYLDVEHGLLRNRLGIIDPSELAQVEAEVTAYRLAELQSSPLPGRYDLAHLQGFHHYIFGDIYDWAGELRTVVISKGDVFCLPRFIISFGADIFGKVGTIDALRLLPRADAVDRFADLLADINALHPFREGNGRVQRAFLAQLAAESGWTLRWAGMDPEENVRASRLAHRGDNRALRELLDPLVHATSGLPRQRGSGG